MIKSKFFGDKAFYRKALMVAIPIMIQNGITNFVSLLDNIMVGAVGTVEMTGVSIANTLLFVFNLTVFGGVSGVGIFLAQFFGKQDDNGMRYSMRYKMYLCVFLSLLGVLVLLLFCEPLIRLYLQGEGNVSDIEASLAVGKEYIYIMLIGIPAFVITQCYSSTLRETGRTFPPMIAGVVAVVVNLMFNYVLIFGKLGAPRLGAAGAAIATVISRYVEMLIVVIYSHSKRSGMYFMRGLYSSFVIPKKLVRDVTLRGMPLMLNEMFWSGGVAFLNQSYSTRGYDVVSAINISTTITNVTSVIFIANGIAIGIIVGQMLGSGKKEEAIDADRKLIVFSVITSFISVFALVLLSGLFPKIYETTEAVRSLSTIFILISAAVSPFSAFANATYFTLRSGGKTMITVIFDSVYACIIVGGIAYFLSRFTAISIIPLYLICQGMEAIKCIVGFILVKSGIWVNNMVEE